MTGPIDAITAMHNAFRKDMEGIDAAALGAARGTPGLEAALERFRYFNEVLEVELPLRRSRAWNDVHAPRMIYGPHGRGEASLRGRRVAAGAAARRRPRGGPPAGRPS